MGGWILHGGEVRVSSHILISNAGGPKKPEKMGTDPVMFVVFPGHGTRDSGLPY